MEAYKVAEGTQVHHDGKTYDAGSAVPVSETDDADMVAYWLNAGWLEPVPAKTPRKR